MTSCFCSYDNFLWSLRSLMVLTVQTIEVTFSWMQLFHRVLSSEYCSGFSDVSGIWNTGFYCPQTGSTLAVNCCGTSTYKYCCTNKPNGTILLEDDGVTSATTSRDDLIIAKRMRPYDEDFSKKIDSKDLTSLNLSDVPIIFGVACGVVAVLILVILAGVYLSTCCTQYPQQHQKRKRRSPVSDTPNFTTTTPATLNNVLVNLYSSTNFGTNDSTVQGYLQRPLGINTNPSANTDSSETFQTGGVRSMSQVTPPVGTHNFPQQSQQCTSQPHNIQNSHVGDSATSSFFHTEPHIHYTVHQTRNQLAVALSSSMTSLSDPSSHCLASGVYVPLAPVDNHAYSCTQSERGVSPPPRYSEQIESRINSPSSYCYDIGSINDIHNHQQCKYLSEISTTNLNLSKKPVGQMRTNNRFSQISPCSNYTTQMQQPKSILRTSKNYRQMVTNETPPPVSPHDLCEGLLGESDFNCPSTFNPIGPSHRNTDGDLADSVAFRSIESRSSMDHPILLLESKINNCMVENDDECHTDTDHGNIVISRCNTLNSQTTEEGHENKCQFGVHRNESDDLHRLMELDLDSKL